MKTIFSIVLLFMILASCSLFNHKEKGDLGNNLSSVTLVTPTVGPKPNPHNIQHTTPGDMGFCAVPTPGPDKPILPALIAFSVLGLVLFGVWKFKL